MNSNLQSGETMEEGDPTGADQQSNVTLPTSAFATTPKDGDRITFCVTGGDDEGVTGYWMTDESEEKEETQEEYDAGLKQSMRDAGKPQI